jgi:hypothetical protein
MTIIAIVVAACLFDAWRNTVPVPECNADLF